MKNLYIELEVYNREIEAKLLLALEAVSKDYNVIIANRLMIQKLALNNEIPPGIIHMKDANSVKNNIHIIKKLKKKNFFFTAQDEESGLLHKSYDQFAKIRFGHLKTFNYLSYFFCWGKRDYNYLKKKTKVAVLTGSPRFDLFLSKRKLKKSKKKILFATSFNVTGIRTFVERIFATTGLRDHQIESVEKFAYNLESFHALKVYHFIKLIRFLSKKFKKYKIVVRPHPSDKTEDWKLLINDSSKNILIDDVDNSTLDKSILSSEYIIQNGCTSAIESLLMNVPCISYAPKKWKDDEMFNFPNSLSIEAKNHQQIEKIIKTKKKVSGKKLTKLKERLFFNDSYSCKRQVQLFEKLYLKSKKFEPSTIFKTKYFIINHLKTIKDFMFKRKISAIEKKFPEFKEKRIKKMINEIASISNQDQYLKTKFNIISKRLLFLTK